MFFGLLDGVLVNLDIIVRSVWVSKDRFETLIELSAQLRTNRTKEDVSNRTRNSQSDGLHEREFGMTRCTGGRARFYGEHYGGMNPDGKKRECSVWMANNFRKYRRKATRTVSI